jgi:hypothetical protein
MCFENVHYKCSLQMYNQNVHIKCINLLYLLNVQIHVHFDNS